MTSSSSRSQQSASASALSVQDLVIQRQRQLLLKEEKIKLTIEQQRLFLSQGSGENNHNNNSNGITFHSFSEHCTGYEYNFDHPALDDYESFSPVSVITKKELAKPMVNSQPKTPFSSQQHQGSWATGQEHQQQHQIQQQHQQQQKQEIDFACLYPRDDKRSRVRFTPALSLYDRFEDDDDDDDNYYADDFDPNNSSNLGIIDERSANICDRTLFLLRRRRRCWYSKEDLRIIKDERKSIVRMLIKRANFNTNDNTNDARSMLDTTEYELRGLENYLSSAIKEITVRKRRDALEAVLNEQCRQRKLTAGRQLQDVERLRLASQTTTEWFQHRALETAQQDARDARDFCCSTPEVIVPCDDDEKQGVAMLHESLHESFALMDIDECGGVVEGGGNDSSTLRFWANSSWTKALMEE